jgi:DNA-directed RNA polymerase specialized sigma24 family protein
MQDWVDGLRRGETESWERLRTFVDGCVSRSAAVLDASEREEITCDTLSTVWETLSQLRDSEKLLALVRTIARRVSFRRVKFMQRGFPLRWDPEDRAIEPTSAPEARELYDVIVGSLQESDRQLFHLLYIDGSYAAELERKEGAEAGALRKRKHVLHKRLRAAIQRYESEGGAGDDWSGRIEDL